MSPQSRGRPRFGTGDGPTMQDVARHAGVSAQTVSRVLRRHPNVSERTRVAVEEAVARLDYRPNRAASALSSGRSRTLGVIMWSMVQSSGLLISRGIESAAHEAGYTVETLTVTEPLAESVEAAVAALVHQAAAGIILALPMHDPNPRLAQLLATVPSVSLDGALPEHGPSISVDQETIARIATTHLLDLGHRTVWHVAGRSDWKDASARERAWRDTLERAGRSVPPVAHGDWTPASGYRVGQTLAADPQVTAIFVASDEMAFGVLRALREAGRQVPDEVSVVGVDDIALAAYASPGLTTVAQPFEEVGERAVRRLLAAVEDRPHEPGPAMEPTLIVRDSSGPPATSGDHSSDSVS